MSPLKWSLWDATSRDTDIPRHIAIYTDLNCVPAIATRAHEVKTIHSSEGLDHKCFTETTTTSTMMMIVVVVIVVFIYLSTCLSLSVHACMLDFTIDLLICCSTGIGIGCRLVCVVDFMIEFMINVVIDDDCMTGFTTVDACLA